MPSSSADLVVTAQFQGQSAQKDPIYRETPPVTVTATRENVGATVAATAAVLSDSTNLQVSSGVNETAEASDPCRKQMILFYSNLLRQYAKGKEGDSAGVSQWLAAYGETAKKNTGALKVVCQGDGAHVTCSPDGGSAGSYQGYVPVAATLSTASRYLATAEKKDLNPDDQKTQMLSLKLDNVSVSVTPASVRPVVSDGRPENAGTFSSTPARRPMAMNHGNDVIGSIHLPRECQK